jgi:hypothetical protein
MQLATPHGRILGTLAAALAATTLALGCAGFLSPPEKPTANVRSVELDEVSLTAVDGSLHADIFNPNGFAVPLAAVGWELEIGGSDAVRGRIDLHENIPAKASAPVEIALHVGTLDALRVARSVAAGVRDYRIRGTFTFSTPVGAIDVTFEHTGML